jgi:endonuclease/exonuclease/phosphatase family metal-dependent hydrolase
LRRRLKVSSCKEFRLDGYPIRVMSFNVRGSFRDNLKTNAWRNRAALNVATIKRAAPVLIGLQECQRGNLKAYGKNLARYVLVRGPRYGNAIHRDHNAILFDPERLGLLDSGGFWLSQTPERYSRSWGARVARSANWALFRVLGTALSLLHLNTHLDHRSGLARREGSKLIIGRAKELSDIRGDVPAIVVTGDFNNRPGSPTYHNFLEAGFADTYLAAGNEDTQSANTFHAFQGPSFRDAHPERGPRRLDWILLKDPRHRIRTESHRIVRDGDEISGLYPSDHYPVLADLALTG